MPQLPSYRRLNSNHQAFVSAYIRHGCDALAAMEFLNPTDQREVNQRRAWKVMSHPDVKNAIADKLEQQEERFLMSRDTMLRNLNQLIEKAKALPDADQKLSTLKFAKDVYHEMNKVLGYHQLNVNSTEQQSIQINLVGIDDPAQPKTIDVDATVVPLADPDQLALSFPPDDPVRYDMSDLDDISDELPEDLPE